MKSGTFFCAIICIFLSQKIFALGQIQYVETAPSKNCFPIVQKNVAANLFVDTNDFTGVLIAANNLQADISHVTGKTPQLFQSAIGNRQSAIKFAIIIGTIGKSKTIDELIREKKIDVSEISNKWESFFLQTISNPFPGIKSALVICGSDQRGTIYGIYDLSEEIGVSPWHFWTDTPPKHHDELFVRAGKFVQGPPGVKYRGIFLNDEAPDLSGWANEKFGGYNHAFYTNIFDLLLRLKANYLWPAMWNNCFGEDDPLNAKLANDYGIVMGTSHVEPMMRADKEWGRAGFAAKDWNFLTHSNELKKFWREGIERNKDYEKIITIAMRGKIDTPMSPTANVALLEEIVAAQRQIISGVMHTNAASVPQLWALYKEVLEYYEKGMRVPDDVTLLWCDDNWGDLRRLPTGATQHRSGGSGIYYHLDYVGGPRNYKWVNSTQIAKIWEQMNLAYNYDARQIWIVNVGHLEHVTFPTEFFLNMAWNPSRWNQNNISEFAELWAEREFGKKFAPQIADIVSKYTKYNARRKPELLSPETFSLTNYNEAGRVLADWKKISDEAEDISKQLPADARDAFFLTVLYPTKASAIVNELYIDAEKNHFYAAQNDPRANFYAGEVKKLFHADAELSGFYNHKLAGGKWDHMADQTHIGYTSWQQPETNVMPELFEMSNAGVSPASFNETNLDSDFEFRGQDAHAVESAKGFIESDGYVSIDASHFTKNVPAKNARWEKIPDLGRTGSAMSIFPVTAKSVTPPKNSPRLEYKMYLTNADKIAVEIFISPTLNFVAGRGLRFAISFDDEPPKIVIAVPKNYSAGDGNHDWETTVKNNIRKITTKFDLKNSGEHTLKIWMVDPGIVLQKIIVNCGGEKSSYLGPPESFRRH